MRRISLDEEVLDVLRVLVLMTCSLQLHLQGRRQCKDDQEAAELIDIGLYSISKFQLAPRRFHHNRICSVLPSLWKAMLKASQFD